MAESRNLIDLFELAATRHPLRAMLRSRGSDGWTSETFSRWRSRSDAMARGLVALGLELGDRVALMASTSPDWVRTDIAIIKAGGVSVPIYPSHVPEQIRYILEDSGSRFAVVEDPFQVEKLLDGPPLERLEAIICLRADQVLDRPDRLGRSHLSLSEVRAAAGEGADKVLEVGELIRRGAAVVEQRLLGRRAAVSGSQPCTFVYTSGTTGPPKGVVLTHDALVFEVRAVLQALDLRDDDAMMLFLPLAHIFARLVYLVCTARGLEMIFPSGQGRLLEDLAEAAPSIVPTVPRVLEKLHASTRAEASRGGLLARRSFDWALATGMEISQIRQHGGEPGPALALRGLVADRMVFGRLHQRLGGRLRYFISGGAPLSKDLADFFHACGLQILEGYGMTENAAAASLNRLTRYKLGTVGQPLPGVSVRLAPDGEILLAGPNLMLGYHGHPEDTAAAVLTDQEGVRWLQTGDIGEIDADGFLRITDRKKDVIVTAGGKTVAPQNIEHHLENHALISRVMVHGDRRPFLTALVTVDEDQLRVWTDQHGLAWTGYASMSQHPEVFREVERIIEAKNRALASYETVKKFAILDRDLSHDEGDLTPTLKVRRAAVTERHRTLLDSFYEEVF